MNISISSGHRFRSAVYFGFLKVLPRLVRALRPFRSPRLRAYREDGCWYVRDFNGFSKAANQLVDGIPELIELFAGPAADRVVIRYSDKPFEGAHDLELISTDEYGSTYQYFNGRRPYLGWLCPVFFWYFKAAPEHLYVTVEPQK